MLIAHAAPRFPGSGNISTKKWVFQLHQYIFLQSGELMVYPIMKGAETGKVLLTAEVNQSTKLIIALWIMPMLIWTTMI